MEYVLSAPNPQEFSELKFDEIAESDEIKKIILEYQKNRNKFIAEVPVMKDTGKAAREKWLQELFNAGNGKCGARVEAVCHMLKKNGISDDLYRRVEINRNHVILEIKTKFIIKLRYFNNFAFGKTEEPNFFCNLIMQVFFGARI